MAILIKFFSFSDILLATGCFCPFGDRVGWFNGVSKGGSGRKMQSCANMSQETFAHIKSGNRVHYIDTYELPRQIVSRVLTISKLPTCKFERCRPAS